MIDRRGPSFVEPLAYGAGALLRTAIGIGQNKNPIRHVANRLNAESASGGTC